MVGELFGTAGRLWRDAPAWKGTVIAAGAFTVLSAAYLLNGPSAPAPGSATAPPPLPSDPASELRLADYEAAYNEAMKIAGVGERCEKMAAALGRLTDEDRARGRNVRASTKARIAAIAAGDRCRSDLAESDKHFARFRDGHCGGGDQPVARHHQGGGRCDGPARRLRSIPLALRRRSGAAGEGKGIRRPGGIERCPHRGPGRGDASVRDRSSAAVYLRLAEAMKQLTDFDRGRLTPGQQRFTRYRQPGARDLE